MFVTLNSWFYKTNDFKYALVIYGLIFLYLMIKKSPISHFLVVTLFSVMSLGNDNVFRMDYALVMFLLFYVVILNIKNRYIVIGKLFLPIMIFFLYQFISVLWTPDKSGGIHGVMAITEGYAVYYIITNSRLKLMKSHLIDISKIATFIMLTLSIEIFSNYYNYGFEKVFESKNLVDLGFSYSNFIAAIYVLLIPIAIYKFLDKKQSFYIYFLLDLINILGLLLTLSRGAFLGFFISGLLIVILLVRKRFLIRYGAIIAAISFFTIRHELFTYYFNFIKDKYLTKDFMNDSDRFPLYRLAYQRFLENFWFGDGIKSSSIIIFRYLDRDTARYHNFILQIAATLGIVGLLLFLFLVIRYIKVLFKPTDVFVLCSAISIVGALAHQMVDVSFDYFYFGLIFYLIIGVAEIYRHSVEHDPLKLRIYGKV